jgi:methyl-accepting chemotaxis protein
MIKFNIGTKLGISAFVSLVLVGGMVGNQARVNRLTHELISESALSRSLQHAALEAKIKLTELISVDRDLRASKTAAEVNVVLQNLRHRAIDANAAYDSAMAIATGDDQRYLTRAKTAFNEYVATAEGIATLQYEIISLRDQQLEESITWSKQFEALINGAAIAGESNRAALEANLQQSNSEFMRAVAISWSRFVRSDGAQIKNILECLGTTALVLSESRGMTRHPQARAQIDTLLTFPPRYRSIVDAQTRALQKQTELILQQAAPLRAQASDMMGLVAIGADQQAESLASLSLKELSHAEWIDLIAGALVIIVMFGVAVLSTLTIGRPIRRIAQVLIQLAGGRNEIEIPYQARQDEVGDAARAASVFRDNIVRVQALELEQKRTVEQAALARQEQTDNLADEFEQAVGTIVESVSRATEELQGTAKSLTQTADGTYNLANSVSVVAAETSKSVRSVAVASEQLASSIAEIGQQAERSRKITEEAVRGAAMTDERIARMSQVANRIGDVLGLITGIAEQTNLLALNATIEAARSGEAGRGFAVVASEVKNLAGQTAKATEEIAAQIADIQVVTRDSTAAIKDIGAVIGRVAEIAMAITCAVEEQDAATRQIAHNVRQAAQGTDDVAEKIKNLEMDASATGTAAGHVFSFASQLASEGTTLKAQVKNFLHTVRSA